MHSSLSRQHTSRSAFPGVLTPAGHDALNLLCGFLQRPLKVSRKQDWDFPLPPTLDAQSVTVCANSRFPEESTVQHIKPAKSSRYSQCTSTNAACQSRTSTSNTGDLVEKVSPNQLIQHVPRKLLIMATHQSPLHRVEIPVPKGTHFIEQI